MITVYAYDTFRDGSTGWRRIKSFRICDPEYLGQTPRSATSDAFDLAEDIKKIGKYKGVKIVHGRHILLQELW
jgi:hypothetical protein